VRCSYQLAGLFIRGKKKSAARMPARVGTERPFQRQALKLGGQSFSKISLRKRSQTATDNRCNRWAFFSCESIKRNALTSFAFDQYNPIAIVSLQAHHLKICDETKLRRVTVTIFPQIIELGNGKLDSDVQRELLLALAHGSVRRIEIADLAYGVAFMFSQEFVEGRAERRIFDFQRAPIRQTFMCDVEIERSPTSIPQVSERSDFTGKLARSISFSPNRRP
jgi:hypothetical protein